MSHAEHQTIKARILAEFRRRKLTQVQFAAMTGLRQPWLSRWIRGRAQAREDALDRMLRALGL
jgi:transcriptional regulator with XRE-family HTH domain